LKNRLGLALLTVFIVLLIDQWLKIYVKTHMVLGQSVHIFDWFQIYFTENRGMAFGIEFGGEDNYWGKLFLSLFRVVAVTVIGWYLSVLIRRKDHPGLIVAMALIFTGALGNIIDSLFYGMIFSDSYHTVATFLPEDGGYAPFLHGHVVDMLYFPLFEGTFPEWFPFWGGQDFLFFRPIFNIADSAITVGVGILIVKQRKFFAKKDEDAVESTKPPAIPGTPLE
jgi:signal peptidase II